MTTFIIKHRDWHGDWFFMRRFEQKKDIVGDDIEGIRQGALDQFVNLCAMISPGCIKVEVRHESRR